MTCEHMNFKSTVAVSRLTATEGGPVTGFMADVMICCADCDKQFQFMGMEAGVDRQGARVSADAKEARLAICPVGESMSTLDRITQTVPRRARGK